MIITKEKNSERDVPNDNALPYNRRYCIPPLNTHPKKRIQKETFKQNTSENDIVQELLTCLREKPWYNSMVSVRMKQSMPKNVIQQANEKIDTLLGLLCTVCDEEQNNLGLWNEADWIDQQERIKNRFRHTILLKAKPASDLVKKHFANSQKMKRRLIQWFDISKENHDALAQLITVVKDKYDNDLDVILNLTNPVNQNTWYTKQAHDVVSELPNKMGREAAKKLLQHFSLVAIQNIDDTNGLKEKLTQCTDEPQKGEY